MIRLEIEESEVETLLDLLDLWIEGTTEAAEEAIEDRSINDIDMLLEVSDGFHRMYNSAISIKIRLLKELSSSAR